MTAVSVAGEDCIGCGSRLCTKVLKFLNRRSLFHSVTFGLPRYVVKAGILLQNSINLSSSSSVQAHSILKLVISGK